MNSIRCFVAVDMPESLREGIGRIEEELRLPGIRLVKPEQAHVTLKFLGDVGEDQIEDISSALRKVEVESFACRARGMGAFPGRTIRVIWLGLQGDFGELHQKVEDALNQLGFDREGRKFSPHVTLGRVSKPNAETTSRISSKIAQLAEIDLGSFSIDSFLLKKSTLLRGGPLYEDLAEFHLSPPR